jgi:hypothetical protein
MRGSVALTFAGHPPRRDDGGATAAWMAQASRALRQLASREGCTYLFDKAPMPDTSKCELRSSQDSTVTSSSSAGPSSTSGAAGNGSNQATPSASSSASSVTGRPGIDACTRRFDTGVARECACHRAHTARRTHAATFRCTPIPRGSCPAPTLCAGLRCAPDAPIAAVFFSRASPTPKLCLARLCIVGIPVWSGRPRKP